MVLHTLTTTNVFYHNFCHSQFINLSPSKLFAASNLTEEEIRLFVRQIDPTKDNLKVIANSVGNISALVDVKVNMEATSAGQEPTGISD